MVIRNTQWIELSEVVDRWEKLSAHGKALYAGSVADNNLRDNSRLLMTFSDCEIAEFFAYRNAALHSKVIGSLDFQKEIQRVEHLGDLILNGAFNQLDIPLRQISQIGRVRLEIVDPLPVVAAAYQEASVLRGIVADLDRAIAFASQADIRCMVFAAFSEEPSHELRSHIKRELKDRGVRSSKIRIEDIEDSDPKEFYLKIKTLPKAHATYIAEWLLSKPETTHARAFVMRPYRIDQLAEQMDIRISP